MLSAASPAWQLICPLWPFSMLFTKGKHILKTLFCLIKSALKTQRHYVLTWTCLTHSIYLVITESDCICAQPYKATWVSPMCLLPHYTQIWGSQRSCSYPGPPHFTSPPPPHPASLSSAATQASSTSWDATVLHFSWMPKKQSWMP